MRRPTSLVFACLAAFLIATPLVLEKPGWPAGLKSDEPAYYLMALSLAHDGDLRCELVDIQRLFQEFPYHVVHNLILATDDGWHTVYFGKPYIYSLFAAPWARLFGASGLVAFNMAMVVLMIWLGSRYLARFNPPAIALLFASGFFLLSCTFSYIFWIHPEIFNMASVTVCLYLALADPTTSPDRDWRHRRGGWRLWLERPGLRLLCSGIALMPAVYNKPMLAAFALPALFVCWERQQGGRWWSRWLSRQALLWCAGCLLGMAGVVGLAMALTGHPSAYFLSRGGQKVCAMDEMPIAPLAPAPVATATVGGLTDGGSSGASDADATATTTTAEVESKAPPKASWFWMFRIPRPPIKEVLENLGYFLWGRHTGLFLYFPFALLALVLFALHRRRTFSQWTLLASLTIIALFFLLWIPFNWQGGGGFVGNRYYVNAYPGFIFLVGRIAPRLINFVGFALGGILLGPTLFSPFGRAVPAPTLQAHVRNFPFSNFPLELSLREVPGYEQRIWAGALVRGRKDVFLPRGARFWVHGATTTELWIQSDKPFDRLAFDVSSLGVTNTFDFRLEDAHQRLVFAEIPGQGVVQRQQVVLEPSGPSQIRSRQGQPVYVYRVEVEAERGTVKTWNRNYPPQDCFTFAYNATIQESFFVGAQMAFLGSGERLERDIYDVEWQQPAVAPQPPVEVDSTFFIETAVRNASNDTWPAVTPTRVALSYRWKTLDDQVVVENGVRTYPAGDIPPGEVFRAHQEVKAPGEPGTYVLELDLVYELVSWFSWQNDNNVQRLQFEVVSELPTPATPTDAN